MIRPRKNDHVFHQAPSANTVRNNAEFYLCNLEMKNAQSLYDAAVSISQLHYINQSDNFDADVAFIHTLNVVQFYGPRVAMIVK